MPSSSRRVPLAASIPLLFLSLYFAFIHAKNSSLSTTTKKKQLKTKNRVKAEILGILDFTPKIMLISSRAGVCTGYLWFVHPHACFGRRLRACFSCETSLATLCTGHANWTAIRLKERFMLLRSPLTGAELLFYASWWGLGARASHSGRVYHSWVLCDRSRCLSSLGRVASESGEMAESKGCRLNSEPSHNLNGVWRQRLRTKIPVIQALKLWNENTFLVHSSVILTHSPIAIIPIITSRFILNVELYL